MPFYINILNTVYFN